MANCALCEKRSSTGYNVSHSNRHTKTRWYPNLHRMRLEVDGKLRRIYVCTRCLRTRQNVQQRV